MLDATSLLSCILLSDTHRRASAHTFRKAQSRQLRRPSDFTDKHTYASSETQWKSILCACFSFPLTPIIPFSPLPCTEHHPLSLLDLHSKPQNTLPYKHTHTHTLTTEAKSWWSHSNKAATRNTMLWLNILRDRRGHQTWQSSTLSYIWVTLSCCPETKVRPCMYFLYIKNDINVALLKQYFSCVVDFIDAAYISFCFLLHQVTLWISA